MALAENAIHYVDERYGRRAAWLVAIVGIAALIAVPLGFIYLLIG